MEEGSAGVGLACQGGQQDGSRRASRSLQLRAPRAVDTALGKPPSGPTPRLGSILLFATALGGWDPKIPLMGTEVDMGRQERPLDPDAGEVERFAADLRALRERAGNPGYRALALRAHYAVTTLSQAAAGNRLPTLEVALAYVRACGADEAAQQEWCSRWRRLARQFDLPGQPRPRQDGACVPDAEEPGKSASAPAAALRTRDRIGTRELVGAALACLAILLLAILLTIPGDQTTRSPVLTRVVLPPDGADPRESGCARDAVNLDVADVAVLRPLQRVYGKVFLRYSPSCLSAWPRFENNPMTPRGSHLVLATIRPVDHQETDYADVFQGEWIWGNMLQTTHGCVMVRAVLTVAGQPPAIGMTRCMRPDH